MENKLVFRKGQKLIIPLVSLIFQWNEFATDFKKAELFNSFFASQFSLTHFRPMFPYYTP